MTERTLAIIKPDAVERHLIGEIIRRYEQAGFQIIAMKMVKLTKKDGGQFYSAHRERSFFESLVNFMASGMIVVWSCREKR
jgi:nucleoside-diphosphate kinase